MREGGREGGRGGGGGGGGGSGERRRRKREHYYSHKPDAFSVSGIYTMHVTRPGDHRVEGRGERKRVGERSATTHLS